MRYGRWVSRTAPSPREVQLVDHVGLHPTLDGLGPRQEAAPDAVGDRAEVEVDAGGLDAGLVDLAADPAVGEGRRQVLAGQDPGGSLGDGHRPERNGRRQYPRRPHVDRDPARPPHRDGVGDGRDERPRRMLGPGRALGRAAAGQGAVVVHRPGPGDDRRAGPDRGDALVSQGPRGAGVPRVLRLRGPDRRRPDLQLPTSRSRPTPTCSTASAASSSWASASAPSTSA